MSRLCVHDSCQIVEVHEAHDSDFVGRGKRGVGGRRRRRSGRTKAELLAKLRPPMSGGLTATVECVECRGGGCALCGESGVMSLYRWHLWRAGCG